MRLIIKIIFRLIAFPFVAGIIGIAAVRNYLFTLWLWLRYGGELMMYDEVFNPETLRELLKQIMKR